MSFRHNNLFLSRLLEVSRNLLAPHDTTVLYPDKPFSTRPTKEYLAEMIGAQRTTVTGIAGVLHEHELISYSRGRVHILNRQGLIAVACECYPVTRGIATKTIGTDAVFSTFAGAIPT